MLAGSLPEDWAMPGALPALEALVLASNKLTGGQLIDLHAEY